MADDMTDADAVVQSIQGIENHPYGFVILRFLRLLKTAVARLKSLEDRVTKLEGGTKP